MKRTRHISNESGSSEMCQPGLHDETTPRIDPFLTPEDYFDELPQRIMERIAADAQKQHENPQPSLLPRKVWMTVAAAAAIAFIFMMIKPANIVPIANSPFVNSTAAASISADYDQTFADEALLLEENEITDEDISAINFKAMGIALNCSDTTTVTTNEIIKYLLDENCDTDLLAQL